MCELRHVTMRIPPKYVSNYPVRRASITPNGVENNHAKRTPPGIRVRCQIPVSCDAEKRPGALSTAGRWTVSADTSMYNNYVRSVVRSASHNGRRLVRNTAMPAAGQFQERIDPAAISTCTAQYLNSGSLEMRPMTGFVR